LERSSGCIAFANRAHPCAKNISRFRRQIADRIDLNRAGKIVPKFGCLCNTDDARFVRVQLRLPVDHRFRFIDVDLSGVAADQQELGAACEKFRSAAFIGLNVAPAGDKTTL